jgi:hypothetical protein
MTVKGKRNENLEVHSSPLQRHATDSSANHAPGNEEISGRAYEIYLERGSFPGNELDDWLQAERELQKGALFTEDFNPFSDGVAPTSETEIVSQRMETMEGRNQ